jgi:hypothetical protein
MAIFNNQMVMGQFSRRQDAPFMLGLREKMGAVRVGGSFRGSPFFCCKGANILRNPGISMDTYG